MKAQGLTTVKAVQMVTSRNLLKIKGFSEAKVDKIKECALKLIANGFISATELSERRKFILKLSTGSKVFPLLICRNLISFSGEVSRLALLPKPLVNSGLER